jgi:DNA polymerase III delta prime subunit
MNNSIGKFVIIIELNNNYLEKSIDVVNEFLNEPSLCLPNIYYFILLTTENDKIIYSIECSVNHYKIINLEELNGNNTLNLLQELCEYYGYSKYLVNLKMEEKIIEIIPRKTFKKINELAKLIGQNKNFEQIKNSIQNENSNIIELEQNKLGKTMEKNISKIYFLLSIVQNGLPLSIIKLYEPQFENIREKEDENKLILTEADNNWYIIEEFRKMNIIRLMPEDKRKLYIRKIIKIYSRLLFYFINKNLENVCFPDSEIHYNFNSYNKKGLWKTFDTDIYERCFGKRKNKINNDYLDILDKDFNIKLLEKHKENIFSLITKNIDIIKDIIFKDKNKKTKEYLCQILIMLPSVFICKKKDIISKCIYICDKLKFDEGKTKIKFIF